MLNILIAEDDTNTLRWLKTVIERDGYDVFTATTGKSALDIAFSHHIDLFIIDVMMPEMNGYEFTKEYRTVNETAPILMISAKEQPEDRCEGLVSGADDYITKPIYEQELLLRIKNLLRRAQISVAHRLEIGSTVLDYDTLSATVNGTVFTLPKKEFYLLYKLLSYPNKIFTRLQLMDEIWGVDTESIDTTVNVHINRLRKKFADCNDFEIIAIRGIGYKAVILNEKK